MTTVEYGGGPTMDQRREFSGLKEGAHIPGYQGYCPQLKYSIGKTYGRETMELSQTRRCRRHQEQHEQQQQQCGGETVQSHFQFKGKLPESTGENKYTENMKSGYTGYVPRWPFKFGKTYKEECDVCLEEFFANRQQLLQMERDLQSSTRSLPSLQAVGNDPDVRDRLNAFHERGTSTGAMSQRRRKLEPPMPGYHGYIPRVHTTELGLGCRYHEMTKNGLENFYSARAERLQQLGNLRDTFGAQRVEPLSIKRSQTCGPDTLTVRNSGPRVYVQDGMIPKYTGYIPQQRYAFGNTYGDETRSLEVCAHDQPCYGDYMKKQLSA
jgi:hypothetical protein